MKSAVVVLVLAGCGAVKDVPMDAAKNDGRPIDTQQAIDAPMIDAPDLSPHVVFVTSTTHSGSFGGVLRADAICQARAQEAGLVGTYMAWIADANLSPSTHMTQHLGPYRKTDGTIVAQGWSDLTDGSLLARIDRTERNVQLGGSGCNPGPTCNFICEGGEVWSNVDAAGGRRATGDCTSWTGAGSGTAGNDGKVDAAWTVGTCSAIGCGSALPLFCVQQ